MVGGLLGGLAAVVGIAVTGGMGLFAVGPLLGATATGGVAGAFVGAMLTRGFEPEIANFYDQALQKGQILVAADTRQGPGREAARRRSPEPAPCRWPSARADRTPFPV